jgi:hypothetical protein
VTGRVGFHVELSADAAGASEIPRAVIATPSRGRTLPRRVIEIHAFPFVPMLFSKKYTL